MNSPDKLTLDDLDPEDAWKLLKKIKEDERYKKAKPKHNVPFPRTTVYGPGDRKPLVTTSVLEIVKFISGALIEDIDLRSNASIKSRLVEAVEWIVENSNSDKERTSLRKIAARVVMIDDRSHLINYVVSLATSLKE